MQVNLGCIGCIGVRRNSTTRLSGGAGGFSSSRDLAVGLVEEWSGRVEKDGEGGRVWWEAGGCQEVGISISRNVRVRLASWPRDPPKMALVSVGLSVPLVWPMCQLAGEGPA